MEENIMAARNKKRKNSNDTTMTGDVIGTLPAARNNGDRLSALPEEILHHILSFLDMKEVVQTSFLSKRWRHTWKSLQDLTFDYSLWEEISLTKRNFPRPYVKRVFRGDECMAFVDRVLFLCRDTTTNIRKIKLSHNYCREKLRLRTWLMLLSPTIKEVDLDTSADCSQAKFLTFPDSLFTSEIDVFVLKSCRRSLGLPRTILCSHLRTLCLQDADLPKGDCNGELTFSNPVLETLNLIQCVHQNLKALVIIAPKLKKLVIRNTAFSYKPAYNSGEIILCAPNLLLLELFGECYRDYSLGDLSVLVVAKIGKPNGIIQVYLTKVLPSLHNVSTLEIFGSCCKGLPESELGIKLNLFHNLRSLGLFCPSYIPTVTKFRQSAPCLNKLVLEPSVANIFAGVKEDDWTRELPSEVTLYPVKCVEIVNIKFHENELKFLTYLLMNSRALETITVAYTEEALRGKKKELAKFRKNLQSLQKESSSVVDVHFLKRPAVPC